MFFFLLASIAFLGMRSVAMTRWRLDRRFKGWIVSGCVCVLWDQPGKRGYCMPDGIKVLRLGLYRFYYTDETDPNKSTPKAGSSLDRTIALVQPLTVKLKK